jgi:hypothetical protein
MVNGDIVDVRYERTSVDECGEKHSAYQGRQKARFAENRMSSKYLPTHLN